MPSTPLHFPAAAGHELAARLELPAGEPRAYALFAHCFTCSKDSKAAAYIGQALAARRIAVLRFDFTGLGMSGGHFSDTRFSSDIEDLLGAAKHAQRFASVDEAHPVLSRAEEAVYAAEIIAAWSSRYLTA